jgi:hypothetical protein
MFTVAGFDPFDANDQSWEDYFSFSKIAGDNYPTKNEFKAWIKESLKGKNKKFRLIYQGNVLIIVLISFLKKGVSGDDLLFIALENIINEPSAALSKAIAKAILQLTNNYQARSFRILTTSPLIQEIIAGFKGKIVNTINYYQLGRNQLNEAVLRDWQINQHLKSGGLSLAIHGYVPENLHSRYAALMTELMNDIIREDNQEYFEETAEGVKQKMELFKKAG